MLHSGWKSTTQPTDVRYNEPVNCLRVVTHNRFPWLSNVIAVPVTSVPVVNGERWQTSLVVIGPLSFSGEKNLYEWVENQNTWENKNWIIDN